MKLVPTALNSPVNHGTLNPSATRVVADTNFLYAESASRHDQRAQEQRAG
jgi:hypothetical protein